MNSQQKTIVTSYRLSQGYDKTEILVKGFSSNYLSCSAWLAPTGTCTPGHTAIYVSVDEGCMFGSRRYCVGAETTFDNTATPTQATGQLAKE